MPRLPEPKGFDWAEDYHTHAAYSAGDMDQMLNPIDPDWVKPSPAAVVLPVVERAIVILKRMGTHARRELKKLESEIEAAKDHVSQADRALHSLDRLAKRLRRLRHN